MADLTKLFSGGFDASGYAPAPEPPEDQVRELMLSIGIDPPDSIQIDGRIHRFSSGTKGGRHSSGDRSGWYIIFDDGVPAGRVGDWRSGQEVAFVADMGRGLTATEEMQRMRRVEESRRLRDEELKKVRAEASQTAEKIWAESVTATGDHPYLQRKKIAAHGARVAGDGRLVVPLLDSEGKIRSLQYIAGNGEKRFLTGGETGGRFWVVGEQRGEALYLAEGYATAVSVSEAVGSACFVAYSANNLTAVAKQLREIYPQRPITLVADNDESGTGEREAAKAAAAVGARVVMPPVTGDANDYANGGGDLTALLSAPDADPWLVSATDFCSKPAPIAWAIKRWLQDRALIMVHGPSGGGKTFIVLDWCLRIAAGMDDWAGNRVRAGAVVYLAGEGHHGMKGRIAAWAQEHNPTMMKMWLSRSGCDLNTPQGYAKVAAEIAKLPESPTMVVVDTLHRFLSGDENSAQDTKTMLDACSRLMEQFSCSVLLVHHTGVSEEAQHRARGSSAWRGALDIEISVVPAKKDQPIEVVQRKSKDAELALPVAVELRSVAITGWVDEDGEQVTSAVTAVTERPEVTPKTDSKLGDHRKTFERSWFHCGCEEREGSPYVSRSGLIDFMVKCMGISEASAKLYVKPASTGRIINQLLNADHIAPFEHGWIVSDDMAASALQLQKLGKK